MAKVMITYQPSFSKSYNFQFVTMTIGTDVWNIERFETKEYEIPSGIYQVKLLVDAYSNYYKHQNTRAEKHITVEVKEGENYFMIVADGFLLNKLRFYTATKEYFESLNSKKKKNSFKINNILMCIGIGLFICYQPLMAGEYEKALAFGIITMLGCFILGTRK